MKMNSYSLKELTDKLIDGKHGGCKTEFGSKYYFISVKDLRPYYIDFTDAKEISQSDFYECKKRTNLKLGDTIYANSGDTIGKSLYIDNEEYTKNVTFQKSIAILSPNLKMVDSKYFYYLMKYNTPRLRNSATGSAQKNLLLDTMNKFKVLVHPREYQLEISNFISKFDTTLKLLYEQNKKLENLMEIYYNYYLNNSLENNEYELFELKDIAEIKTGKKDANFATINGKYKFFTCSSDTFNCDEYDFNGKYVLVAGNGSFNVKHYNGKFNAYQRTYVIKCKDDSNFSLVYKTVSNNIEKFTKSSNGSIVKFIRLSDIEKIMIKVPKNKNVLVMMDNLLHLIQLNNDKIDKLENCRDIYLKMFMSNKLDLKRAE